MLEADGIDPKFLDDDDDEGDGDFDTITIGETGFSYKVRAGGLDGAPDLGDEELDKLYSESWRAAMEVELGAGAGGGAKRNALAGGGNFGGGAAAVSIQLPSVAQRAAREARRGPSESAMSSLGPTRPASAAMMRDAGRILSVDSFDDEAYDEGDAGAGVSGDVAQTSANNINNNSNNNRDGRGGVGGGGSGALAPGGVVSSGGGRGGGSGPEQVLVRRMDGGFDLDGAG